MTSRHARLIASLDIQSGRHAQIRSAHLLQVLRTDPELALRWDGERALVDEIKAARAALESGAPADASAAHDLRALQARLKDVQGEQPMVPVQVDGHVVAEIVAGWTGIPLGKMVKDDIKTVLGLKDLLEQRVLGQSHAIEAVAQRVRTSRANLDDPNKPKGVFLFVGPSGIGKTETALALADVLYGGERKLITINMSEYQEAHSVSGLKGLYAVFSGN